ncbi:MAG TPA: GtrA family protein [Bacilli bacterium]|nr:GtrA family protein [Bacilli bacterium]
MNQKKSLFREIIRFVIVGVIATVLDYGTYSLLALAIPDSWSPILETVICTTIGFIVSVIANYLLSVIWVFQNVDQKADVKSKKNIFLFVALSAGGLLLGTAVMIGFETLASNALHVDINNWISDFQINYLRSSAFWFFTLFFGIKTLVILSYNYITRKKLIFKSPKEKNDGQITD